MADQQTRPVHKPKRNSLAHMREMGDRMLRRDQRKSMVPHVSAQAESREELLDVWHGMNWRDLAIAAAGYMPHQGPREKARRTNDVMARAFGQRFGASA